MRSAIYSRWEKNRESVLLTLLDYDPNAKVIDLGCGDGKVSAKIKEKIGCSEMWGIDICHDLLEKAKERGLFVKKADLNNILPLESNSFDVAVSNQVIEHLFYPVHFLKEICRILKPSGYAVISTENLASWDNIVALLLGYTPFSIEFDFGLRKIGNPLSLHNKETKDGYTCPHVRIFSWNGLTALAELFLFKIEKASGIGHVLGRIGEIIDKKHCRFITLKLKKMKVNEE